MLLALIVIAFAFFLGKNLFLNSNAALMTYKIDCRVLIIIKIIVIQIKLIKRSATCNERFENFE